MSDGRRWWLGDVDPVDASAGYYRQGPTGLTIPADPWAEGVVVACAVASQRGAELARARIRPEDVYDPRLRRLFEASLALDPTRTRAEPERIATVAAATGLPRADVEALVDDRPSLLDERGGFAGRVLDASRRREAMTQFARAYNELGRGARLDEIADTLRTLEALVS